MRKQIVLILLTLVSFSFTENTTWILIPGVGIENEVTISKTTKKELYEKFGNDGVEIPHYTQQIGGGKGELYSTELVFAKHGVSFYFKPKNDTVNSIVVSASSKAKTNKGIELGVSTMRDVTIMYGDSRWLGSSNELYLMYPGIEFKIPYSGKVPIPKETLDSLMNSKVNSISITKIK